jgi:DNA repair protein RadD
MIELRDYQHAALDALRGEFRQGHRRVILQALTGLGKTVMASAMIQGTVSRNKTTLFVAHRRELIRQASDKLTAFGVAHGIIMPGENPGDLEHVYVGTVQSFTARMKRKSFEPHNVSLIIFDEGHRSSAASYQEMLAAYPNAYVICLTATPTRGDEKGLGDTYTAMVQTMTYEEAFERGFLVRPKYYAPYAPDMDAVRTRAGDYAEEDLEAEMNRPELTGDIVSHYARHAALPDGSLRLGMVFAVNVRHSIALAAAFNAAGILAAHLDGETPTRERDEVMRLFRAGEISVLCNVGITTEGVDVPECSAVVLACPTKSVIKHLQTAGRALRPHPESGKTDAIILDHAGNVLRLGVIEDYKDWTLDKGSQIVAKDRIKEQRDPKEITCDACGHLFYSAKVCPSCGFEHVIERSPREIETGEGELLELGKSERRKFTQDEKRRWYSMMLHIAATLGKKPGYAYFAYKKKFACGPDNKWQKNTPPTPPDPEVSGWMQHYRIWQRKTWEKERLERAKFMAEPVNAAD